MFFIHPPSIPCHAMVVGGLLWPQETINKNMSTCTLIQLQQAL